MCARDSLKVTALYLWGSKVTSRFFDWYVKNFIRTCTPLVLLNIISFSFSKNRSDWVPLEGPNALFRFFKLPLSHTYSHYVNKIWLHIVIFLLIMFIWRIMHTVINGLLWPALITLLTISQDDMDKKIRELTTELEFASRKCEVYRANLLSVLKDIEDHKLQLSIKVQNIKISLKDGI